MMCYYYNCLYLSQLNKHIYIKGVQISINIRRLSAVQLSVLALLPANLLFLANILHVDISILLN